MDELDLTALSPEDLSTLLNRCVVEQERRSALATIPGSVAALARTYTEGGGDLADLTDAITQPPTEGTTDA